MVSLGPSASYHNQNYSDYRSAYVIPIYNSVYVILICNLIDFGHDWLRMDQDSPFTNEKIICAHFTATKLLY